jgi:hypothetical protein
MFRSQLRLIGTMARDLSILQGALNAIRTIRVLSGIEVPLARLCCRGQIKHGLEASEHLGTLSGHGSPYKMNI